MEQTAKKEPKSLSDHARTFFRAPFEPIAIFLNRKGVRPNTITLWGLVGQIIGAICIATGHVMLGGLVILLTAPFDFLDGMMARLRKEPSDFGAFIDSVTDRYSELFLFGGLLYYFTIQGDWISCLGIYMAAAGSQMVSYARSRAESLGFDAKIGLLTRFERYLVMVPALVFNIPMVGVWILAVLTNFTALQRIFYVRRQYYNRLEKK